MILLFVGGMIVGNIYLPEQSIVRAAAVSVPELNSSNPVFTHTNRESVSRELELLNNALASCPVVVDAEKAGNGIMVLCNIRLKQHSEEMIQQFIDAVQNIDEITECFNTSGDYDFMIKVYARDMHAYQQFMQHKLGAMSCLGSLHSVFVMAETKNTHGVAILP